MEYIFELMTWCGFVCVMNPDESQMKEAKLLNEIEGEEEILEIIQGNDFHVQYPSLAGIRKEF